MLTFETFIHAEQELHSLLPSEWESTLQNDLKKATEALLGEGRNPQDKHIELNLMSNTQIKKVNAQLRNIDKPTDVISLCFEDTNQTFGEIYISLEKCRDQAKELEQSMLEELRFLFIHGVLHIFGYDHQTETEEAEMMGIAYKILGRAK